jgi:LPS O-antigen subunit length determinant protein (WzzB/FepE family)
MSERNALPSYPEDEISLIELLQILVRRKLWIAGCFLVAVGIGLAYAFLATPLYEVEVHVDKPFSSELAGLNVGRNGPTGLSPFPPEQVFGYFANLLMSDVALQRFFARYICRH